MESRLAVLAAIIASALIAMPALAAAKAPDSTSIVVPPGSFGIEPPFIRASSVTYNFGSNVSTSGTVITSSGSEHSLCVVDFTATIGTHYRNWGISPSAYDTSTGKFTYTYTAYTSDDPSVTFQVDCYD